VYGTQNAPSVGIVGCRTDRDALRAATRGADVLVIWGMWKIPPLRDAVDIPIVYVCHGSGDWSANCARLVENEPVHLTAVSEAARLSFSPQTRHRVRVIHNGIEVDRCTPTRSRESMRADWGFAPDDRLVGYAGRYSSEKNAVAAALAVTRLPSNFQAVYAGAGLHESSVRSMVQHAAGSRARFVPADRRIGNLLQAFDVTVTASPAEGFSLLVAEAWYCGVPVVSTRVGAIPELEAVFGQLVSPLPLAPTPNELAHAVEVALSASFQREVVPRAKALVAEHFTASRMAERWTNYLTEICAQQAICAEPSP
jgi:glycosyltransferase involved in cell wall biosynthesis